MHGCRAQQREELASCNSSSCQWKCSIIYSYRPITNAWLKETALVERALDFAIVKEKLDVVMIKIDDNAKSSSLITSYTRINCPDERQ